MIPVVILIHLLQVLVNYPISSLGSLMEVVYVLFFRSVSYMHLINVIHHEIS